MEIINLVINILGYLVLGWFIWLLRNQINLQKDALDSQSKIIQNMKIFVDIFQPEKIHEFMKMREITFEDIKNKEIEKVRSEMEKKLKKRTDVIEFAFVEASSLLEIALQLAFFVDHESRKEALGKSPNSISKTNLIKIMETFPYYGDIRRNALAEAFLKYKEKHLGECQAGKE